VTGQGRLPIRPIRLRSVLPVHLEGELDLHDGPGVVADFDRHLMRRACRRAHHIPSRFDQGASGLVLDCARRRRDAGACRERGHAMGRDPQEGRVARTAVRRLTDTSPTWFCSATESPCGKFNTTGKSPGKLSSPQIKNISLYRNSDLRYQSPSRAHLRDVSRSSRYVGHRMRWTLWRQRDSPRADENAKAYGEIVWSWRRDPGATLAGVPAGNGGKKGRLPGYSIHTFWIGKVVPYLMLRKASRPMRITFGPGFP
jgi:hypothetical protein